MHECYTINDSICFSDNHAYLHLRAATNESQKTRNKKQETKRFSTFAVSRLRHSETLLDSRIKFLAKHV